MSHRINVPSTLKEAAQNAVSDNNAQLAGQVAERLRARGLDYAGTFALVNKWTGIEARDWEALMLESEEA